MSKIIKIGGASGYWGDCALATPQLLAAGLDYIVYDYLAEITMSIMARAKAKDPAKGYATDFINAVLTPFLPQIAASGVKLIANAGGVNPRACGQAARKLIADASLDLKVAVITGDDLTGNLDEIAARAPSDMFSGAPLPPTDRIASVNAYLGAFPIARALAAGADIVITGRCVDSAVTLGACIHEFGWGANDWDALASGSLAGHILECGSQATGGNFTDWETVDDFANIGFPIAEISADGSFVTTKPAGTGGLVTVGTVAEQMLYEIGDPQQYLLPDVCCDFSQVRITHAGPDRVQLSPAKGYAAPGTYKTCLTYLDGYRAGTYVTFYGAHAQKKAAVMAEAAVTRANAMLRTFNLGEYTQVSSEILGAGSQFGEMRAADEVVMKVAVKHPEARGVGIFLKEMAGMGLGAPPGLSGFTGAGRAKPSPVVRLFSYLTPKKQIKAELEIDGEIITLTQESQSGAAKPEAHTVPVPDAPATHEAPLIKLAWGRSGDKGNKANIGLIARKPEYLPYIAAAMTPEFIQNAFGHFMDTPGAIKVFYLPGTHALNILIDNVLGGGGAASLRNDAQAKGYAQILLSKPVPVSAEIAKAL